jgi:hypothetical protein
MYSKTIEQELYSRATPGLLDLFKKSTWKGFGKIGGYPLGYKPKPSPSWVPKEIPAELKAERWTRIHDIFISKILPILNKLTPDFGDGDEYPIIDVIDKYQNQFLENQYYELDLETLKTKNLFQCYYGMIYFGYQSQPHYIFSKSLNGWYDIANLGKKIPNIKIHMLSELSASLIEYEEYKKTDKLMWEDNEYDQVITYISTAINLIKRYL